jgi:hypothetical protein
MNFMQSKFCASRLRPLVSCGVATIGLSILAIGNPAMAKLAMASAPPAKAAQTIALQPTDEPGQIAIARPSHNFRLLGYGLFLLQVGLIPLKLAKGNQVQTMIFDRPETIRSHPVNGG